MMKKKSLDIFIIEPEDASKRLDAFLSNIYKAYSRSFIQKQIKMGNILLNDDVVKSSYSLKVDDKVEVLFSDIEKSLEIPAQDIPLEILYEDTRMLVVNKPCGMLTHPTSTENTNTLVNALIFRYGSNLSDCNGSHRPGIVHRLDRNTSGLLMIAKDNEAYEFLKEQIQKRAVKKKYYAVVCGNFDKEEGTIESNIGRHPSKPEKMAVVPSGKHSVTHYKVLEKFKNACLVDIDLETGRTHQIRVHMSSIGHPIINDTMYGGQKIPVKTDEQVLQAYSLTFMTPETKEIKHIEIGFDSDIIKVLNYLRSKL